MQVKTKRTLPVQSSRTAAWTGRQGRPAWHGLFRNSSMRKWETVTNKSGHPIVYSKRIYALLAAVQQLYIQHGEEDET